MPVIPASLLEMQKWFAKIVASPLWKELPSDVEKWITHGPKLTARERIGLYHEQYWIRLFENLQEDYPTLLRIFGEDDFNHLIAEPYLLKYPFDHWSLRFLGTRLPQWIDRNYHEEDKILVSQVAHLDEIYKRLQFAKKREMPTDFSRPFYLQPFVALLELNGDLFSFREKLLEEEPEYWIKHPFPKIKWGKKDDLLFL